VVDDVLEAERYRSWLASYRAAEEQWAADTTYLTWLVRYGVFLGVQLTAARADRTVPLTAVRDAMLAKGLLDEPGAPTGDDWLLKVYARGPFLLSHGEPSEKLLILWPAARLDDIAHPGASPRARG